MLQLPNGCSCSTPSIFPKNWKTSSASVKHSWKIQYYFYDPNLCPKGKLIVVKSGVNRLKIASERKEAIALVYSELVRMLQDGFNPITGVKCNLDKPSEIDPFSPWISALEIVKDKLKLEASTLADLKCCIGSLKNASHKLQMSTLPINQVTRKHIKIVLENIDLDKGGVTAHKFNKLRSYLMMLFKELIELEAIEINPVRDISKRKTIKRVRLVLNNDERVIVNNHLKSKYYAFWRFMQIFFHSGARIKELLSLQIKSIDIKNQRFLVLIKKGKQSREEWRTIKNIALPYWIELVNTSTNNEDYLFSAGLKPGPNMIRREQITRRWNVHVKGNPEKGGLGIKADFYSLKHLNLDETAAELDIQAAAKMAGHTTPVVTLAHYAIGETGRQHDRLKKVANTFSN